jgi:hypothetical protein
VQITQVESGQFLRGCPVEKPLVQRLIPFRNFARTRFRDSTRRVQKNHFGRRRLGILSRSLANGAHSKDKEVAPGISSILLEHAQREMSHPQTSFRAPRAEPLGVFTTSPSRSSRMGSEATNPRILDSGSCESLRSPSLWLVGDAFPKDSSLRAEMDRVLEFSRTVGLCKYLNSRRGGDSASLASDDAESEVGAVSLISILRPY